MKELPKISLGNNRHELLRTVTVCPNFLKYWLTNETSTGIIVNASEGRHAFGNDHME